LQQVQKQARSCSRQVRYTLKAPYRDGTTHIVLEPLDLMARLAALVPPPRMHLTRFHGVFAPHSQLRAAVTPAHRGVGGKAVPVDPDKPITPRHVAMCWAQRLKRVFGIEIDTCGRCGGKFKVQSDREHRRAGSDCEDSGASAEDGAGFASNRVAPGSASTSPTGTADMTPGGEIPHHLPRAPAAGSG